VAAQPISPPPRAAGAPAGGLPSTGYAHYVLGVLFLVTAFNVADRNILSILLQPIKQEFGVSDTLMGLLGGSTFAIFHALSSLPIARLADRGVRRTIIAVALFAWSAMTALSGLAQGYGQLLLARIGVSAAEGGGAAPGHALLSDYFAPQRRATALAIFGIGGIVGIAMGHFLGGLVNERYGWRAAFFVLGVPGMALALLVRLTVREPARGAFDPPGARAPAASAREVLRYLLRRPSYPHMVLAASFHAFAAMAAGFWYPAFLIRVHGMNTAEVGVVLPINMALLGALGAVVGGRLADRLGLRDARWYMWVPALSSLAALPFAMAFLLWPAGGSLRIADIGIPHAIAFLLPASFLGAMWNGPTLAMVVGVSRPQMRSLAAAGLLSTYNFIGLGLGPLAVGAINDALSGAGPGAVRYGLLLVALAHLWGCVHNALAARSLRADLEHAARG
jgi:predicted MFS family arabinose efflux permease